MWVVDFSFCLGFSLMSLVRSCTDGDACGRNNHTRFFLLRCHGRCWFSGQERRWINRDEGKPTTRNILLCPNWVFFFGKPYHLILLRSHFMVLFLIRVTWFLLLINVLLVEMQFTRTCSIFHYFSASVSMIFINKAVIMQCPHSMTFLTLRVLKIFNNKRYLSFRQSTFIITHFSQYSFYDLVLLFSSLCCVGKWLIHRLYIVGDKMGHSRANVIVLAT